MKKYIKASDTINQTLSHIRKEVNDYIKEYYEAWGYDLRDYSVPKCSIKKQQKADDGKFIYKITVDMDVFDTYPSFTIKILENLDDSVHFWLENNFEVIEEFSWDGNTEFTSYIKEI